MQFSRQNRQLLFTLLLAAVLAMAIGYLAEEGVGVVSERTRVMELAGELAKCTNREEYLELINRSFPGNSPIWQSPAMNDSTSTLTTPAVLEQLPDGRFRVAAVAMTEDELLEGLIKSNSYVYLPAALVDDAGRGHLLEDVRLNSRGTDLVFEYYYGLPKHAAGRPARRYFFFLGQRQWELHPVPAPRRRR